jgi:pimeloyl-ACP methyl ester carboxylesterase
MCPPPPALLTRICGCAASTSARISSATSRSARTKRPPQSAAVRVPPSVSTSDTTTSAPAAASASAIARPVPIPAPVTSATRPAISIASFVADLPGCVQPAGPVAIGAMKSADQGYAPVNDLRMYYEAHGTGDPLVLLHGSYMTVDMMEPLLSGLARTHRVIVPEQQGHGRTNDADRPITYEQMADDTAALMAHLGIDAADIAGYSLGGGIALQLALRHPERVRRLVVASASFRHDGMHAQALEMFPTITPEMFAGSPMEAAYQRLSPHPEAFPTLVRKLTTLDSTPYAWPEDEIRAIAAPTLIVLGDSDGITLEHAVEFFKLRGGGVMGDLAEMPASQLAVLPGTSHFVPPGHGLLDRSDWLLALMEPFLA